MLLHPLPLLLVQSTASHLFILAIIHALNLSSPSQGPATSFFINLKFSPGVVFISSFSFPQNIVKEVEGGLWSVYY